MLMNKRAQLDEINWAAVIFALIAGVVGVIITMRMDGGVFLKVASFVICAVAAYFVSAKIMDTG